jgi:hypothetical protein
MGEGMFWTKTFGTVVKYNILTLKIFQELAKSEEELSTLFKSEIDLFSYRQLLLQLIDSFWD